VPIPPRPITSAHSAPPASCAHLPFGSPTRRHIRPRRRPRNRGAQARRQTGCFQQRPVHYVDLDGQALSLDSATIDHVLTTWTLCSIPDVNRALSEIRRVLRPGAVFHFVEHGRSPERTVAGWQDRLTPIQRRVAGGCHLNRPIDQLVQNSGLTLVRLENYYAKGPRAFGYVFEGIATKS
jgi:SAM-dependent methyltransferase